MATETVYRRCPEIVLREELDEWALLFNPENGGVVGINSLGVALWTILERPRALPGILQELRGLCEDVPARAEGEVAEYLEALRLRGFVTAEPTS